MNANFSRERDFVGTQTPWERRHACRWNRNFVNVRFSNRRQECRRSRDSNFINFRSRGNAFSYNFDEIGNRTENLPNALNQPTIIGDFVPAFDADGNMTSLQTSTGTWSISWNSENRPIRFENAGTQTVIECAYDYLGRRFEKKVTIAGTATSHQRYIYRGFLQIACLDCLRSAHPDIWLVLWDPTQSAGTRPLAIQKDGAYFTFGWDITKNIWEVFGQNGYIRTSYSYDPFGNVSESGDVSQPFQWSSEFYDSELALVYYNYRHYSPNLGRWISEDPIGISGGLNLYFYCQNSPIWKIDDFGCVEFSTQEEKCCACLVAAEGGDKYSCQEIVAMTLASRQLYAGSKRFPSSRNESTFCEQANKPGAFAAVKTRQFNYCMTGKCASALEKKLWDINIRSSLNVCRELSEKFMIAGLYYWWNPSLSPSNEKIMAWNIKIGNCVKIEQSCAALNVYACDSEMKPIGGK